jgi:hypothetical protein
VWRINGLAGVRFCKRRLAQDTLKAWHEGRCGSIGAHGVLGEQSAPNKHINAHTLCALNVAFLGGNFAADLRVIFTAISAQGKTPLNTDAPDYSKPTSLASGRGVERGILGTGGGTISAAKFTPSEASFSRRSIE